MLKVDLDYGDLLITATVVSMFDQYDCAIQGYLEERVYFWTQFIEGSHLADAAQGNGGSLDQYWIFCQKI